MFCCCPLLFCFCVDLLWVDRLSWRLSWNTWKKDRNALTLWSKATTVCLLTSLLIATLTMDKSDVKHLCKYTTEQPLETMIGGGPSSWLLRSFIFWQRSSLVPEQSKPHTLKKLIHWSFNHVSTGLWGSVYGCSCL